MNTNRVCRVFIILLILIVATSGAAIIFSSLYGNARSELAELGTICDDLSDHISEVESENELLMAQIQELSNLQASTLLYLGEFESTAYCACEKCCGSYASGKTATGTTVKEGRTIAVDPKKIKLGSKVVVEFEDDTQYVYIAEDTGSAVKGNIIDIYFDSHIEALNYGRQNVKVYLVEE